MPHTPRWRAWGPRRTPTWAAGPFCILGLASVLGRAPANFVDAFASRLWGVSQIKPSVRRQLQGLSLTVSQRGPQGARGAMGPQGDRARAAQLQHFDSSMPDGRHCVVSGGEDLDPGPPYPVSSPIQIIVLGWRQLVHHCHGSIGPVLRKSGLHAGRLTPQPTGVVQ